MNPPAWGIAVVLVVGIAVIALGVVIDRRRLRRARAELSEPPDRAIPGLLPTVDPAYVTDDDLDALPPTGPSATAEAELALLERRDDAATLPGGTPDGRFLNHPRKALAILLDPAVLVTDADVASQRDTLTVIAAARRRGRPLVWVARSFAPDVLGTLRANAVTGRYASLPIELVDPLHLRRAVAYTGGRLVAASDLDSDWLPAEVWGTCAGWVADTDDSWVVPPAPDAAAL